MCGTTQAPASLFLRSAAVSNPLHSRDRPDRTNFCQSSTKCTSCAFRPLAPRCELPPNETDRSRSTESANSQSVQSRSRPSLQALGSCFSTLVRRSSCWPLDRWCVGAVDKHTENLRRLHYAPFLLKVVGFFIRPRNLIWLCARSTSCSR